MDFFRELRELRGNQGREGEEEGVISIEPITMIVPSALQDLLERITPESTASSSVGDDGGDHHASSPSSLSSEETPSHEEETGNVVGNEPDLPVVGEWENRVIMGRSSNLRKAPKDLPAGFRFRAALHHEVADSAPSISGYKKLEEMVRAYQIPGRYCSELVHRMRGHARCHRWAGYHCFMLLCERLEIPAKAIVCRLLFQCQLCPNSRGAKWYYLSGREKSQLFKNLLPRDTDLKNQLLEYARRENLIDLETLVISEQFVVFGFVDVANQFTEGEMSNILGRQRQRAQGSRGRAADYTSQRQTRFDERPPPAPQSCSSSHRGSSSASRPRAEHKVEAVAPGACRRLREDTDSEDEVPLIRRRTSLGSQPTQAVPTTTAWSPNMPSAMHGKQLSPQLRRPQWHARICASGRPATGQELCATAWWATTRSPCSRASKELALRTASSAPTANSCDGNQDDSISTTSCDPLHTQGGPVTRARARKMREVLNGLIEQIWVDNNIQQANRSLDDYQGMSQAEELASRNNELREELERACAEKESGIQAAKDEAARVEEQAKKAEAERDHALNELSSLRHQVVEATKNLNEAEEALNELKTSHGRSVSIARARGAEWLVGSAAFQDAVAVASANMTTEIYNEISGKVLQHRPDFPIRELAFFDGEDLDEQGKSLTPLADATVRLRWELNEEGVPVWPPSVLEEREDPTGLPSFNSWVEGAPVAEQEPSSTPPNSQLAVVPARSPVSASAHELVTCSSLARSSTLATDVSMPVDLTDD
ncbi:hypothetical protein SLEP1_g53486 [Rubroshorea leprosula]|uniref:Uncharacterized protein n=1 Tax=Rubroshorea leprosula TaxID=152421 RepID=A0AAV5M9X3_9ROSI|nr:hypothetical protein SLEP1_g53486 [Rubroshorea leprosula]